MGRLLFVLALILAFAALFAFGLSRRPNRDIDSIRLGKAMIPFEAPLLPPYQPTYGGVLNFEDYLGQPVIVTFWASWCLPCQSEAGRLEAAWRRHQGRIMMIGVNFQDDPSDASTFIDRFQLSFPSVKDPTGAIGIDWGVFGLPETYFIRTDGTLGYKHSGEITSEVLETQLSALLLSASLE